MDIKFSFILISYSFIVSCSSLTSKEVSFSTTPTNASIQNSRGVEIAKTPATIPLDKIETASNSPYTKVQLKLPGYETKELYFDKKNHFNVETNMTKLTESDYKKIERNVGKASTNALIQNILKIHSMIVSKRYLAAKPEIAKAIKQNPSVASLYTFAAVVNLHEKDKASASKNLNRALTLDASDPVAARLKKELEANGAP